MFKNIFFKIASKENSKTVIFNTRALDLLKKSDRFATELFQIKYSKQNY